VFCQSQADGTECLPSLTENDCAVESCTVHPNS